MQLWLDATDLDGDGDTTDNPDDGTAVSTWGDKKDLYVGGSDYSAVSAVATQPTFKTEILNSKPVIRFGGSNSYLSTPTLPSALHTFAVFKRSSTSQPVIQFNGATAGYRGVFGSAYYVSPSTSYTTYDNYSTNGASYVAGAPNSATGASYHIVSGKTIRPANTVSTNRIWDIGGTNWPSYAALNGDIAEIIVYNRELSDEERRVTECYLSEKWGITISYP